MGGIRIVPFPGLAVVVGKGLAPEGMFGIGLVPSEYYNNGAAYLIILAEEKTDAVAVERAHNGRVYGPASAIYPVEPPQLCYGIERADRSAFVYGSITQFAQDDIEIAHSLEAGMTFHGTLELGIFLTIRESCIEVFILHHPSPDEEVEVFVGRRGGGGDDQFPFGVKF